MKTVLVFVLLLVVVGCGDGNSIGDKYPKGIPPGYVHYTNNLGEHFIEPPHRKHMAKNTESLWWGSYEDQRRVAWVTFMLDEKAKLRGDVYEVKHLEDNEDSK